MNLHFTIDECLTPELVGIAYERGHDASHVAHMGMAGAPDFRIVRWLHGRDTVFTTNDRRDFLKLFGQTAIHNG